MDPKEIILGNPDHLLLLEFAEAWAHYRHLEESRGKYLGFFFTVLIATLGLLLTIFKDLQNQQGPWLCFGILMLIWLVNIFSFFIFTTIKKAGFVLRHYEDVIRRVREIAYKESDYLDALLNVREKQHPVMKMTLFSTQKIAELIPLGTVLLLSASHGTSLYYLWDKGKMLYWQQATSLCLLTGLLMLVVYVFIRLSLFHAVQKAS